MSNGEHSLGKYLAKRVSRAVLSAMIAPLAMWEPMRDPADGFTVIVGCGRRLESMIPANVQMLARQRAPSLREVLLVIDGSPDELSPEFAGRLATAAAGLPVRCLHYNDRQKRVTRRIDWGWVYSWLSWSTGIAECRTRHAMLHDFDALLLDPGIIEQRYQLIRAQQAEYLGMGYYRGSGVAPEDGLVKTFELMFDAEFVRRTFRPIELFNTMARFRGKYVEFDTFLNAQSKRGRIAMTPIDETEMVHPSQMICQFVDHASGRARVPEQHNLLMIPYYEFVGGDDAALRRLTEELNRGAHAVPMWGRPLGVRTIGRAHAAWLRKQAYRLEAVLRGDPEPRVVAYFDAIDRAVGPGQTAAAGAVAAMERAPA